MIAGLLLASGASRRFGSNKLVAPLDGRPSCAGAPRRSRARSRRRGSSSPRDRPSVRAALDGLPVRWVENPEAHEGMASSIRAGIAALPADAEAVVITLGDQPLIDRDVIRRVVAAWRAAPARRGAVVTVLRRTVAATRCCSAPRSFPRCWRSRATVERGSCSPRSARRWPRSRCRAARPADVDTPEALASLARATGGAADSACGLRRGPSASTGLYPRTMHPRLAELSEHLAHQRRTLLDVASTVPADSWQTRPGDGRYVVRVRGPRAPVPRGARRGRAS